jgi:prepilin-type N-terminal cleavage/methylation domain-containing protein
MISILKQNLISSLWAQRNPAFISSRSAGRRRASAELGMTLLEIMIVLAIIAVVMGFLVGPRVMSMFQDSKVKTTQLVVKKIADEAYPAWSLATSKACPGSLSDLKKYMNKKDTKDDWGNELVMLCGENAPSEATNGFGVVSNGPDGKKDTEDDIKSWEL